MPLTPKEAIQMLLDGRTPPDGDYSPFTEEVKTLTDALREGGLPRVQWTYGLMADNLELAEAMCDVTPTAGQSPQTAIVPSLKQIPGQMFMDQSADDEGNAQCVNTYFGGQFLYCEAYGYLRYTGKMWSQVNAEAALQRAIVRTLRDRTSLALRNDKQTIARASVPTSKHVRDCLYLYQSLVTVHVADFDNDPDLCNVNNGALNLRTKQLTPHDPTQRFTYCVPVDYNPMADAFAWQLLLKDVVGGGPEVIDYVQMAVGYSLTGHTNEECLFYIHGPTRSGKGTFSETLLSILPQPLGMEVDFTTFTATRDSDAQNFDLAPLKPARMIFASESNKYSSLNTGKIKSLTGGNDVRCAFKHKDHFSYRPQYKIWLVSNWPVNADVDDDAAWYRVKVIEFPNSHADTEDKQLKARMKQPANLEAVLAWAVEGAHNWYQSPRGLVTPQCVVATTAKHRADMDFVQTWLDECTTKDLTNWESAENVYRSYADWCKQNGVKPKEQRGLSNALKQKGYQVNVSRWVGTSMRRGIVGFTIR